MIQTVVKRDGSTEPFNEDKLNKWAEYAARHKVPWSQLAKDTYIRLEDGCSTEDIHETMIKVCLSKQDINWSRVAARLEFATIRSGMKTCFGHDDRTSFEDIYGSLISFGYWDKDTLPTYNPIWEEWYKSIYDNRLEFWQVKQWNDKYAIKEGNLIIETPHIGALGIGLAIHGDTEDAYLLAESIIEGKLNLPTPVLNGCRNGDFDGISCCVISGGDSVESIEVAKHIATRMTAKKAGIGIEYTTRTKGSNVKEGRVKHLGKAPIYAALDKAVKMFTQVTRGGSATTTFNCIDPEIESLLLLKSQRTPENLRIDKLDYSMAYNEAFINAVVKNEQWPLYDYLTAKEVYDNFHLPADEYLALAFKYPVHSYINARELLKTFLTVRQETGRVYCVNLTRANEHTPFVDPIKLSNLCQEIFLPTKPYRDMYDLYGASQSIGETAFCSLSAINVSACKPDEIESLARIAVYTINRLIDLAPMMTGSMKESILRRRSIGVGITGLAGALYKRGLDYDSPETLQVVSEISERHAFYLYKASCDYAYDHKVYVGGITDWLPIDTRKGNTELKLDWESLRGIPRANSVLIAHMPTESSALFSNATNGLYPVRSKITEKLSRKGKVQFIAPAGNYKLAWDHDNNTLSPVYGIVQDFSDQGISADYYVVPTRYPGGKVPLGDLVKQWITQAKRGNKSMYYTNTNDFTGGSFQDMVESMQEDDGCNSGACKL